MKSFAGCWSYLYLEIGLLQVMTFELTEVLLHLHQQSSFADLGEQHLELEESCCG